MDVGRERSRMDTILKVYKEIAKSSTMQEMEKNFEKLKEIDENAYEDLKERGVQHWCRAHFNTDCKVASVDNNLAESRNWSLVELRGKPIIYTLDDYIEGPNGEDL
ncbi:hypothetical protein Tco_0885431 [Tanacetum coccineum]